MQLNNRTLGRTTLKNLRAKLDQQASSAMSGTRRRCVKLVITRGDGERETVTDPRVIDAYLKAKEGY